MKTRSMTAKTHEIRSGDRVRNGMVIAGMSSTGVAIILDPYITALMAHQTRAFGIVFEDPQGWKSATVQVLIVAITAVWGVVHMRLIRLADRIEVRRPSLYEPEPPAPPPPQRPPAASDSAGVDVL